MALGVLGAAAVSFSRPYTLAGSAETLMLPPLFYNYCEEDEWVESYYNTFSLLLRLVKHLTC